MQSRIQGEARLPTESMILKNGKNITSFDNNI